MSQHVRSNPDRMWKLRMKFVAQARKYFGVPYAKKNFSPDSPEYNSPIFLDCCGLVRRVMRDLEDDFGFRIGCGNQAYMYDTLPKTIENLEDVKPGDLVFISAIYYNPKMKKQRHNMCHVEIMLADGEKTIGARWNNGTVQEFNSYKFVSKSYHSMVYTFKSIDTWLLGLCKSYCAKHLWSNHMARPLKNSIFSPHAHKKNRLKRAESTRSLTADGTKKKKKKKRKKKKKKKSRKTSTCQESNKRDQNNNNIEEDKPTSFTTTDNGDNDEDDDDDDDDDMESSTSDEPAEEEVEEARQDELVLKNVVAAAEATAVEDEDDDRCVIFYANSDNNNYSNNDTNSFDDEDIVYNGLKINALNKSLKLLNLNE